VRLALRQRAEHDIDEAYAWYESRQEGLGELFLRSIDACLDRLRREPQIYAVQHDRIRRTRVHRFPYWAYYVIRSDHVDVLSIYHERRRPRRFKP
jgi:plasmid stabilization system protein ParE